MHADRLGIFKKGGSLYVHTSANLTVCSVAMRKTFQPNIPDFRNLGVILRSIVLVEGVAFLVVFANETGLLNAFEVFAEGGLLREPLLLVTMAAMYLVSPLWARIEYQKGVAFVLSIAFALGMIGHLLFEDFLMIELKGNAVHSGSVALLSAAVVLVYFNWRQRVLSPALSEARLLALQARIRPHFLFNSLNTVLGLIRDEPERAETVLENLAELYRALLSEPGILVTLDKELELARAYAGIEAIRLGERLRVNWQCQEPTLDALVPTLILQPLLENAIYHGVEPSESGGEVGVSASLEGDQLNLTMRNPCTSLSQRQGGHRMALENIRERLDLHFDAEAEMRAYREGNEFVVQIRMPYRHA